MNPFTKKMLFKQRNKTVGNVKVHRKVQTLKEKLIEGKIDRKIWEAINRKPDQLTSCANILEKLNIRVKTESVQKCGFMHVRFPDDVIKENAKKMGQVFIPKGSKRRENVMYAAKLKVTDLKNGIGTVHAEPSKGRPVSQIFTPLDIDKNNEMSKSQLFGVIKRAFRMMKSRSGYTVPYVYGKENIMNKDKSLFGVALDSVDTPIQMVAPGAGLSTPYCYMGVACSVFPLHVEDFRALNSASYNGIGGIKMWVIIPVRYYNIIIRNMTKKIKEVEPDASECEILHKRHWVHLEQLVEWNIDFNIVLQRAGEMVVTANAAFHQGINLSQNYATAINLILADYMDICNNLEGRLKCSEGDSGKKDIHGYYSETQYKLLLKIRKRYIKGYTSGYVQGAGTKKTKFIATSAKVSLKVKKTTVVRKLDQRQTRRSARLQHCSSELTVEASLEKSKVRTDVPERRKRKVAESSTDECQTVDLQLTDSQEINACIPSTSKMSVHLSTSVHASTTASVIGGVDVSCPVSSNQEQNLSRADKLELRKQTDRERKRLKRANMNDEDVKKFREERRKYYHQLPDDTKKKQSNATVERYRRMSEEERKRRNQKVNQRTADRVSKMTEEEKKALKKSRAEATRKCRANKEN